MKVNIYVIAMVVALSSRFILARELTALKVEIQNAPAWSNMKNSNELEAEGPQLIAALVKCKKLTVGEMRQLIQSLLLDNDKLEVWSKIYLLNRMYCKVPDWIKKSEIKYFGGWGGIPVRGDMVQIIYPLRFERGSFSIEKLMGSYTGPNYYGVEEFDFLIKKFGVRN